MARRVSAGVSPRDSSNDAPGQFGRELIRLGNAGFIKFELDEAVAEWIIELDFDAIARYQIE